MPIDNQTKSKSTALSTIMGNKNLAAIINDALNSPAGSTKREKANAILKSLNRAGGGYSYYNDGQGGNGAWPWQQGIDTVAPPPTSYPNISVSGQPQPGSVSVAPSPSASPALSVSPTPSGMGVSPTAGQAVSPMEPGQAMVPPPTYIFKAPPPKVEPEAITDVDVTDMPEDQRLALERDNALLATPTGTEIDTMGEEGADSYYDRWYGGLDQAGKIKWKTLYDSLKSKVGPKTFAYQYMQEDLDKSSSLVDQLTEVRDRLKEDTGVEELRKNVQDLETRGLSIETNLLDYVAARDEHVKQLDTMIDGTLDKMAEMDLSDPETRGRMNRYVNYLYTMKGRTQKRYIDYVNSSITFHNDKLTRANNSYETALNQFNEMYETEGAKTEENYNQLFEVLTEMYQSVSNMEEEELRIDILRNEVVESEDDAIIAILENLGGGVGKMTATQKVKSQQNYFADNPGVKEYDWYMLSYPDKLMWLGKEDDDLNNPFG